MQASRERWSPRLRDDLQISRRIDLKRVLELRPGAPLVHAVFQLQLPGNFAWSVRINGQAGAHGGAGGVVYFVDQARSELGKLPLFIPGVAWGLDIQVRQHTKQRRANIDALAPG